ncbi:MAG: transglutaminase family protein [Sulfuriferula sp.]
MTILAAIHHSTHYQFDRPVILSAHEIRLKPAAHSRTPISAYSLKIEPALHFIHWQQDAYGNFVARVSFPQPTKSLHITVDLIADLTIINPFDFFIEPWAEFFPFSYPNSLKTDLAPFLITEPQGERFKLWLATFRQELPTVINSTDFLVSINQAVQKRVAYLIRMEPGVQSPEATLTSGSGSCRDSAWLLVQALRHLGIAARFVSGYLIQLIADDAPAPGMGNPVSEFTDLHAWCEAFIPGAGWVGLDATSGLLAGEGHIPLAATASPGSAAPVSGLTTPCESTFDVVMTVSRLHEDPRVTKPYTEVQWQKIQSLGAHIDAELTQQDVRLTQGGEPTFVATDNMESAEWNSEALGEQKWTLANTLMQKLHQRFARGGILHYGQGKWYPGEPLPRWALTSFWRTDGEPVWRDTSLLAEHAQTITDAEILDFARQLCRQLGLHTEYLIPAYEDPWVVVDAESRLPVNLDPASTDLDNADVRRRLAQQLRLGLNAIAGYVLPVKADDSDTMHWQSSLWPLRQSRLYLLAGDSALGYRLPLASLPWVAPEERDIAPPVDPYAPKEPFSEKKPDVAKTAAKPPETATPKEIIHTALALQQREGFLYVFMPPISRLEAYLDLLAAIEKTAESCKLAIRLEGYPPPRDTRLQSFSVTPDPGVIEVNIHPSTNWNSLVERTEILYEAAKLSGLGTEKFMLDGRHTGTGGGNHITLGGASPADSPFLRRPDVLQSLITFWQHHPALSYLFSGQFIGPTSQAPRVDEARDDNLYELEIAFQQMRVKLPAGIESQQPWLIDRLLRNLLVDLTGNTHRAEFCIDKLYSPDSATGRLGIVELRAFEMPPHYRMSLVQALLLRALVAHFWNAPYQGKPIHWGTSLHDKFMLPHFIAHDIHDVCLELRQSGYAVDEAWFAPFLEFRFPRHGLLTTNNIQVELRQAIEPWHVLGEEMTGGGTARYVDSSVERMQIKVSGMTEDRYQINCNGRRIPLHATGIPGEFVAGVRYKAWAPHSALHPTIAIQVPLVFDLIDSWNQRAIAGCTYHVSHPGGRNYDTFPVNANEAEARRRSRFWDFGHTPGTISTTEAVINPRFPMTLDLRWQPE